jgi:hypothetical protein
VALSSDSENLLVNVAAWEASNLAKWSAPREAALMAETGAMRQRIPSEFVDPSQARHR